MKRPVPLETGIERPGRFGLILLGMLAACASQPRSQVANVNLSGYPPAFKEGYSDGCASAGGRRVRNDQRIKSDSQYSQGWHDGLDICRQLAR